MVGGGVPERVYHPVELCLELGGLFRPVVILPGGEEAVAAAVEVAPEAAHAGAVHVELMGLGIGVDAFLHGSRTEFQNVFHCVFLLSD